MRRRSIPQLLVAEAILAAGEPWHPARRDWRESARDLGTSGPGPGDTMRFTAATMAAAHSAADNLRCLDTAGRN